MDWTPDALPDLTGKTYAITGGNSGIGLEAAKILTQKGARVVISSRTQAKAEGALKAIRAHSPNADVAYVLLDLADASTLAPAAEAFREACPTLDAFVNNAGVMQPPLRRTAEGWELQFATNHLGHFKLNSLLFPHLEASGGRFVVVSSIAHHMGKIHFDDLQFETSYDPTTAYAQSKLANILYAFELQRRLQARGSSVVSIPVHPGYSATNLQTAGVEMEGGSPLLRMIYPFLNLFVAQAPERGAYPTCLAAADPTAKGGTYYGPTRFRDMNGPVGLSRVSKGAQDTTVAAKLWERTEALVGPFFA